MKDFLEDLKAIAVLLDGETWALSGSGALRIRGVDTTIGDIDVDVHADRIDAIKKKLSEHYLEEGTNAFGYDSLRFNLNRPIEISLIPREIKPEIVNFGDVDIPAEKMSLLHHVYSELGRDEKVKLIENHMESAK